MRSRTTETCARDDLLRAVHAALVRPAGVFADRWEERRTHRAALDRWSGRLRYDVYRLTSPTPLEPAWSERPESLTFLYGPVRLDKAHRERHSRSAPAHEHRYRNRSGPSSAR